MRLLSHSNLPSMAYKAASPPPAQRDGAKLEISIRPPRSLNRNLPPLLKKIANGVDCIFSILNLPFNLDALGIVKDSTMPIDIDTIKNALLRIFQEADGTPSVSLVDSRSKKHNQPSKIDLTTESHQGLMDLAQVNLALQDVFKQGHTSRYRVRISSELVTSDTELGIIKAFNRLLAKTNRPSSEPSRSEAVHLMIQELGNDLAIPKARSRRR
ncbi:MAG: hypothetical protein ACK551_00335 [Vampirovibrionales bacterium]